MKIQLFISLLILAASQAFAATAGLQSSQAHKELIWYNIPSISASGFIKGDVKSNRNCRMETKFSGIDKAQADLVITLTVAGADGFDQETRQVKIPFLSKDLKTGNTVNLFPLKEQGFKMASKSDKAYYRNGLLYVKTSPKAGEVLELRMNVDQKLIPVGKTEISHYRPTGSAENLNEKIMDYSCNFDQHEALHRVSAFNE